MELAGSSWVGPVWRPKLSVPPRLGAPLLVLAVADDVPPEPQAARTGPAASRPTPAAPRRSRFRRVRPGRRSAVRISPAPGGCAMVETPLAGRVQHRDFRLNLSNMGTLACRRPGPPAGGGEPPALRAGRPR